jgi:hypothetical protein
MLSAIFLAMEQLTPELERRLQVEELWARRNVLSDSINARRRDNFRARHIMLSRLGTQALPLPAHVIPEPPAEEMLLTPQMSAPQPMRPVPAHEPSVLPRVIGFIGAAAAAGLLLAVGLQNTNIISGAGAQLDIYMPRLIQMIYSHAQPAAVSAPPHAQAHARAGDVHAPDLRAEVAAQIAAISARH